MNIGTHDLAGLVSALAKNPALSRKRDVQRIARAFGGRCGQIRNGDDCAAIADGSGYTLLAAEGMLPAFVEREPWFAGFCAVMTNVSDIAAMGGRPLAVADVLFAGADEERVSAVLDGLCAGAEAFGVPVVGGHTSRSSGASCLAAAIVGKARALITSFDARPGDVVLACIDLQGHFRGDSANFDAATTADTATLRAKLELLPELAEAGLVHAGKDISMAGLVGTLLMLLETSGCSALLDLAAVPAPEEARVEPLRWLQSFPSYGYLLVTKPAHAAEVRARFHDRGVHAETVAELRPGSVLDVTYQGSVERYWDLERMPLTGFAAEREGIPHRA